MYTTLQLIRNCLCRYHMAYANRLNKYLQCRHYNEIHKPEKSEKFSNELKILCRIENLTKKKYTNAIKLHFICFIIVPLV
jgi:hypothetical protein